MILLQKWSEMTLRDKAEAIVMVPFVLILAALSAVVAIIFAGNSAKKREADTHLLERVPDTTVPKGAPRPIPHPHG